MKGTIISLLANILLLFSCKNIVEKSDEQRLKIPIVDGSGSIVIINNPQFSEAYILIDDMPTGPYIKYDTEGNILTKRIYFENELLAEKQYHRTNRFIDSVILVSKIFLPDSSFYIGEVLKNKKQFIVSYPIFKVNKEPIQISLKSKGLDKLAVSVGDNYNEDLSQKHYFSDASNGVVFIRPSYTRGVCNYNLTLMLLNKIAGSEDEYNSKEIYIPVISFLLDSNNLPNHLESKILNKEFVF